MPARTTDAPAQSPRALREAMVAQLRADHAQGGRTWSAPVEQALLSVPREAFAPGLDLAEVYDPQLALVTKRAEDGIALSSISAPSIIATMLDRADLRPGHRVLEIGSGGYNAALMAELVGEQGRVTSIDIDPEIIERAGRCLDEAGYAERVRLAVADGEHGFGHGAPFDRIVVTAGAWDVPASWWEQLAEGGLMVVPLRVRGLTRCLTLQEHGGRLRARHIDMCGFVRMQGLGEHWEPMPCLSEEAEQRVALRLEDGPDVDATALSKALFEPGVKLWSGVVVSDGEPTDSLDLWIASVVDEWAVLTADPGAVSAGVISPTWVLSTPAVISPAGDSFAYRTLRPAPQDEERGELGAIGHGPRAQEMAERLNALMVAWDHEHRHGPGPDITLFARNAPHEWISTGRVVDKKHTRMVITWPSATPEEQR